MPARFTQTGGDLSAALAQMGGRITRAVNDRMEAAMQQVLREARARAPREHGNLEDAIKLRKEDQRRSWTVYVDESMPDDTGRYTVGDYAAWLHEGLYEPGPGTVAKGPQAGRKFIENPFREIVTESLLEELRALLKSEIAARAGRG